MRRRKDQYPAKDFRPETGMIHAMQYKKVSVDGVPVGICTDIEVEEFLGGARIKIELALSEKMLEDFLDYAYMRDIVGGEDG